eukprot:Awhi_evm1s15480
MDGTVPDKLTSAKGIGRTEVFVTEPTVVTLFNTTITTKFAVVPQLPFPLIIGLDILKRLPVFQEFEKKVQTSHPVVTAVEDSISVQEFQHVNVDLPTTEEVYKHLIEKIKHLSGINRSLVLRAFKEYNKVWSTQKAGTYTGLEVFINVAGPPIRSKPRPTSPVIKKALENTILELIANGMIRNSKSPWAAPTHMVLKSDRINWRLVIDYRLLNKQTTADSYPIPRMMDLLYEMCGDNYYSTIDLEWGFYHLRLAEESKKYTAFVCHMGLFEWNVLPMGFKNAPAEFQRVMDLVVGHLYHLGVRVYIDDIIIKAKAEDENIKLTIEVLRCLSVAGLRVKIKKINICQPQVKALGHILSTNGISVDPERFATLRNLKLPTNKDELRSFLGSVAYVKSFIPNYSSTTSILSDLLKKNVSYCWTTAHTAAYELCLQGLEDGVTLSSPSDAGSYVIVSDASITGVGSALLQLQNKQLVLIAFYSKTLSEPQRKWDTRERELYAIKHVSQNVNTWLLDTFMFLLIISLCYGHKMLNKVKYKDGLDWLSRCAENDPEADNTLDLISVPVLPALREHVTIPGVEEMKQHYNDIGEEDKKYIYLGAENLYYGVRNNRLFIPETFRHSFIFWVHTARISGHRGIVATRRKLAKIAFWPGLNNDVQSYVKGCWTCARNGDVPTINVRGVLERPYAFELISVDYVGPREVKGLSCYYLVVICHCTRFMVTAGCTSPNMKVAIHVLRTQWIPYFGVPRVVLADNAFRGEFQTYVQDLGSILLNSSTYNPKGNGINERSHNLLEKGIAAELNLTDAYIDFASLLRDVTYAYNTSFHSAVRETPYYAVFGKDPLLPGFQEYSVRTDEGSRLARQAEHQTKVLNRYNVAVAQEVDSAHYEIGDLIIFFRNPKEIAVKASSTRIEDLSLRYTPRWSLPARVTEMSSNSLK